MSTPITIDTMLDDYKKQVFTQTYGEHVNLDGVLLLDLHSHVSEDGSFSEIARLNDKGELLAVPGFRVKQVNRSILDPQRIKAWHLHYKQDEIWFVNQECKILVGLFDTRKDSPSSGKTQRIVLGGGKSELLFIPKGLAHGSRNLMNSNAIMWYFVNEFFDKEHPDEQRLPFDTLGADFWDPKKE